MKVGMISAAHVHAQSYAEILRSEDRFEFVGLWDDDRKRGMEFAKSLNVAFYDELTELLNDVEIVVVTSENTKHTHHVLQASKSVRGILCEKPLATSVKDAERMVEECEKRGVKLGTAFPVRFHPVAQKVKDVISSGKLGKPLMITSSNRGKLPPGWFTDPTLSGGGAITDHVVHLVDLFRWFTGQEFTKVKTFVGTNIHPELPVEDCAILSLELGDIPMTLDCSWAIPKSYPYWGEVKFRVIMEKGVLEVDVFSQNIVFLSNVSTEERWIDFGDNADRIMLLAFADWVKGKIKDFPSGYDGMKATQVVEKAYESAKLGEEVVVNA
ncbi:MAG: Gfo/Idh/MocA family oxidoreductase [Thermotogae bacterium]|nr:Gfo/Idh/MocA family oxidoreductase [Thermotogota bacterium]